MSRRAAFSRDRWWLAANVLGAMAYLWLSSGTWIEPELRGEDVAWSGDAVVWFTTALPVLVAFIVVDCVWFTLRVRRRQRLQPMLLAAFLWVIVLGVDRLQH